MIPISELYKFNIKSTSVVVNETFAPVLCVDFLNGTTEQVIISRNGEKNHFDFFSFLDEFIKFEGVILNSNYTEVYIFKIFTLYFDIIKFVVVIENNITYDINIYDLKKIISGGIELFINDLEYTYRKTAFDIIADI